MKQIIVIKAFRFAHRGIDVEEFVVGPEPVETTDECADLAVAEKWAKPVKVAKPVSPMSSGHAVVERQAELSAPEVADDAVAPELKGEDQ